MSAFRLLSSCFSEIERSERKAAENRANSGWRTRKKV